VHDTLCKRSSMHHFATLSILDRQILMCLLNRNISYQSKKYKVKISYIFSFQILFFKACIHGKNDFAEVPKNLTKYRSGNNFGSPKQLCKMLWLLKCQNFLQHYSLCLHNFDNLQQKLFSNLYLVKFLDISENSFRVIVERIFRIGRLISLSSNKV